jgi:serine/threonine-protein kinase
VALKFLPEHLNRDIQAREMLLAEVRIARSIAHPNVCRVYDIHEYRGRGFLTMEFIDGEDLEGILQRSGRLRFSNALALARQLLSGLAEAHRLGIVHRDLKPSNIMVDGHGIARISDFGLAMDGRFTSCSPRIAGTPDYMAPEVARGEEATIQSDLYSLGLILLELFSGRRITAATSGDPDAATRCTSGLHDSHLMKLPSSIRPMIAHCVQTDPGLRPLSADALLSNLPELNERDILFDSPRQFVSPEWLAFLPNKRPVRFWSCALMFAGIVISLLVHTVSSRQIRFIENANLDRSPAEQLKIATSLLSSIGHEVESGGRTAIGFEYVSDEKALRPLDANRAAVFWYRQSKHNLIVREQGISRGLDNVRVSRHSPPLIQPADVRVELWGDGLLRSYECVRPAESILDASHAIPRMYTAAGLDQSRFEVDKPFSGNDGVSVLRETRNPTITVTTTVDQGKLIRFQTNHQQPVSKLDRDMGNNMDEAVLGVLLIGGIVAAVQNVRRGQGDRSGALKLALFICLMSLITWATIASHVRNIAEEIRIWRHGLANAFFWGIVTWSFYLALEPTIRRHWPDRMISWNRLLHARWTDATVARDVLIGILISCTAIPLLGLLNVAVRHQLGLPPRMSIPPLELYPLLGVHFLISVFSHAASNGIYHAFVLTMMPLLFRKIVRSDIVAIGLTWTTLTAFLCLEYGDGSYWLPIYMSLWTAIYLGTMLYFGLLASAAMFFAFHILLYLPVTANDSAWYWPVSMIGIAALISIALVALVYTYPKTNRTAAKTYVPRTLPQE